MHLRFWTEILQLLEGNVSGASISLWLSPLRPLLISDEKIILEVPNLMHQRIVEERYIAEIRRCAMALSEREMQIEFVCADGEPGIEHGKRFTATLRSSRVKNINLNSDYTFENFIVGQCNRSAYLATVSAAASPARRHNPLFITGGVGLGKTHLLQAIGARTLEIGGGAFIYIPCDQLMDELMWAFENRTISRAQKRLASVDVLLVDDIHSLSGKNQVQEEFYRIFNMLYNKGGQIVLSSDRPPENIPRLQQRLVSRFGSGLISELKPPGLKTRVAIIESKSKTLGLNLPHKVIMLLASRIRMNIRRIEGAINRISAYCKLYGRPPDQEIVDILLRNMLFDGEGDAITIGRVQRKVAGYFSISISSLLGNRRSNGIVLPRQMAMFLCRKLINSPYADIGAAFSGRDHTTAIYSCKTIKELLVHNNEAREILDELITAIRA